MGQVESVGLVRELSDSEGSSNDLCEHSIHRFFSRLILAELQAHGHDTGTSKLKLALSHAVERYYEYPWNLRKATSPFAF